MALSFIHANERTYKHPMFIYTIFYHSWKMALSSIYANERTYKHPMFIYIHIISSYFTYLS